jgi:hypothetical protein
MTDAKRAAPGEGSPLQKNTTGFSDSTSEIATSTSRRSGGHAPYFTLKLQGRGNARADIRGLRAILKTLLRRYGFRCLDCREERRL